MEHFTSAAEAVKLIKSYDKVYIQGSTAIPEVLTQAMADRAGELTGVEVYSAFCVGTHPAPFASESMKKSFSSNSFFVTANTRKAVAEGYAQCIPAFLGEIPAMFRSGLIDLDVVLLNVSLPNEQGYCSFGISADLTVSAVESAKTVIAQINPQIPYCYGDGLIHINRIDAAVRVDASPVDLQSPAFSPTEEAIGRHTAELIPDGATLQVGVGCIPNAILSSLTDHKHLGLHTEALTDGVVPLIEKGIIDNSLKKIMPGKSIASLAVGTKGLYSFMNGNKELLMKDVAWTNDPYIIRQNPKVMAINSAIEIDLTGQVCADSIGDITYSGVGGQHDFMYGGALSEGGKTFIVLPSMTLKGQSKIKAHLMPGAGVITTRPQTQYVVTEYGAVCLKGKNLAQRAKALISIAHPTVREELERAAAKRFGYSFTRL